MDTPEKMTIEYGQELTITIKLIKQKPGEPFPVVENVTLKGKVTNKKNK